MGELIGADQLKDKTLVARVKVPVYRSAGNAAVPYGYVEPGQPVGVVYSWLDPNGTSRTSLWWMFLDANQVPYYTPHKADVFDVDSLKQQGVITADEETAAAQKAKDKLEMSPVEYYIKYYGKYVIYTVLGGVVLKGLIAKI